LSAAFVNNSGLAAFGRDFLQIGHNFSDDCLTLNVWTKPQSGERQKAVLVFFYGGGNNPSLPRLENKLISILGYWLGATNNKQYDGARLANDEDVVVVTVKYVVSISGWKASGLSRT
jgi:cholinesterase